MNATAMLHDTRASRHASGSMRALTVTEVLFVYAGILLYIWQWQFTRPIAWVPLFAVVLASHLARRETPRTLGLTAFELRPCAEAVLPLALALYVPVLLYGLARHHLELIAPPRHAFVSLSAYGLWCVFQQYLVQSYFHRRLMAVVRNAHVSSLLVAVMFGAAHLPNPVLVAATTLGGLLLAEIYARHPNIWPLALGQAAGGLLIAAITPASLIHNMRVGPGYFFYQLR